MSQILSWDALRAKYPDDRYIFLVPQVDMYLQHDAPLYRLDVGTVKIDPNDEKLAYHPPKSKQNELALTKIALDRLITTAGGWAKGRIDHYLPGQYIQATGIAAIKTSDGTYSVCERSRDWIAEVEEEEVRATCKGDSAAAWRIERRFALSKTESKAVARAIRAILAVRSTYDRQELACKQFVVPRWALDVSANDPEIRRMLVANALGISQQLYGGAAQPLALPASQPTQLLALPGGDDDDDGEASERSFDSPSGFTPPPAEPDPDRPPLMKWDELAAKVAGATCISHLDHIVAKYTPSAELIGATVQWVVLTEKRRAEFGGHAPTTQPSPEELRNREVEGLVKQITALLATSKISDSARTYCRAELAKMQAAGNVNGLRDQLLWLEDQPKEVSR